MNHSQALCDACRQAPQETLIDETHSSGPYWPYRLCFACARRLTTYSLRPLEWFHLAAIHGPGEFFLHNDFYSEDGEAQQPKAVVVEPDRWPIPKLAEASRSNERSIRSMCCARSCSARQTSGCGSPQFIVDA